MSEAPPEIQQYLHKKLRLPQGHIVYCKEILPYGNMWQLLVQPEKGRTMKLMPTQSFEIVADDTPLLIVHNPRYMLPPATGPQS